METEKEKSYAFWWLTGKNIIDSLHNTQDYLKNYRSTGNACKFDTWNKEFYFNCFTNELRSLIESMHPYLKKNKIDIKIPTSKDFKDWEKAYYELIEAMPKVGLTDLKRQDDDPDADVEHTALDD